METKGTIKGETIDPIFTNNDVVVFEDKRAYTESKSFIIGTGMGCVQAMS